MPNPIPIRPGGDFEIDPMFHAPLRAEVCAECWELFETRIPAWTERLLCPQCSASFLIELEEFAKECEDYGDA